MALLKPNKLILNGDGQFVYSDSRMEFRRVQVVSLKDSDSDSEDSCSQVPGTRKRKRLTNLSPEEKLLRRKLKNRVAAQTARDRKKARMQELEDALAAMEAENKKLLEENANLKQSTSILSRENINLKSCLTCGDSVKVKKEVVVDTTKVAELSESAVLECSQQKRQAQATILLATTNFLTTVLTVSMIHCLIFWTGFTKTFLEKNLSPKQLVLNTQLRQNPVLPPWWGSHQQSWNPVKTEKQDT